MKLIDDAKQIVDLIRQLQNQDLYRRILDLQSEIMELIAENLDLKTKLAQAAETLRTKEHMVWRQPYYWVDGDDTPFCPKCWSANEVQIHLSTPEAWNGGIRRVCHNCEKVFWEKPMDTSGAMYITGRPSRLLQDF